MKTCTCTTGQSPNLGCPLHGDLAARYGLRGNAYLLGRTYASMANRVRFVRKLAQATGTSNQALELIDAVMHAVSRPKSDVELSAALAAVSAMAADWGREVTADGHGPGTWVLCPAYGKYPVDDLGCGGYYLEGYRYRHLKSRHTGWWGANWQTFDTERSDRIGTVE